MARKRRKKEPPKNLSFDPKELNLAKAMVEYIELQQEVEEDVGMDPVPLAQIHGLVQSNDFSSRLNRGFQAVIESLKAGQEA